MKKEMCNFKELRSITNAQWHLYIHYLLQFSWKKELLFIILPVPNSFCLLWQNTKNAVAEPFVPDPSNKIFFAPTAQL